MDELNQILKHEEDNKRKIALAQESAREEISRKEEDLKQRLLTESVLQDSEKDSLVEERDRKIKEAEEHEGAIFKKELKEMKERKDKNMDKAVSYIIESFKSKSH